MMSMIRKSVNTVITAFALAGLLSGCGLSGSSEDLFSESMSEIAAAAMTGAANGSEANGSQVASHQKLERTILQALQHAFNPLPSAFAAESCPTLRTVVKLAELLDVKASEMVRRMEGYMEDEDKS